MLYEIVNPSDQYTLKAEDRGVACAAALILGHGAYALTALVDGREDQDLGMPLFLLARGNAVMAWFKDQFGADLNDFIEEHDRAIADCLDSVMIGRASHRDDLERAAALIEDADKRALFWAEHHDRHRSSMNDIGSAAKRLAAQLREGVVGAPQRPIVATL